MFDILPKALASVASFLFPLFASYKALNSADPAELTPWLMYWVVLSCVVLVESWTEWLLVWIPFYHYFRLGFLLYLVLPQTQGARVLYQTHLHPWLTQHEARIDELIGSAHARLRSAGLHYIHQAIAVLRGMLGLPSGDASSASSAPSSSAVPSSAAAQSYTQALLARFTLPNARRPGGAGSASNDPATAGGATTGADFYNLLASAVGALGTATGAAGGHAAGATASALSRGISLATGSSGGGRGRGSGAAAMTASGTLVPPGVRDADRASFLATQRDRLRTLLSALEREAAQLEEEDDDADVKETLAKTAPLSRPLSGASAGGLSKSRSEADFEKIDAESGTEEEKPVRQRRHGGSAAGGGHGPEGGAHPGAGSRTASGSWLPWGWGGGVGVAAGGATAAADAGDAQGASSSVAP